MTRQVDDPNYFYTSHVFVCTNRRPDGHEKGCCASKDSERLRNYMKRRAKELGIEGARINGAGCLDRCEKGPALVIYPEGIWYSPKNEADCDEILTTHLQQGGRVTRLMMDQ
ncbi:MAG: (2Fe-2S) ferredoxin domain-containing protein [Alphaproteobacteria bacterium]|nr:(2Fe-2S) ferredoxin domain-containing protein [Alphaproteobacteria bacterium]MBV8548072.1 (2Fe-2S) ferredoxin domain-containing protein [Alphaproteobacteria bacterium]